MTSYDSIGIKYLKKNKRFQIFYPHYNICIFLCSALCHFYELVSGTYSGMWWPLYTNKKINLYISYYFIKIP